MILPGLARALCWAIGHSKVCGHRRWWQLRTPLKGTLMSTEEDH